LRALIEKPFALERDSLLQCGLDPFSFLIVSIAGRMTQHQQDVIE